MSLRTELLIHGYDAGEDRLLSVLSYLGTQELTCIADFEGESVCTVLSRRVHVAHCRRASL